jgi:hypothetical protein
MHYFCSLAVVLVAVGCNGDRLAKLEAQNEKLKAQLKQQQTATNLDLQAKCAKQAVEIFNASGYKEGPASYTNHYNTKLNKCFVAMYNHNYGGRDVARIDRFLYDAFERTNYAAYRWMNDDTKSSSEGKPWLCQVTIASGEVKVCKFSEEFDELIKPYMEQ